MSCRQAKTEIDSEVPRMKRGFLRQYLSQEEERARKGNVKVQTAAINSDWADTVRLSSSPSSTSNLTEYMNLQEVTITILLEAARSFVEVATVKIIDLPLKRLRLHFVCARLSKNNHQGKHSSLPQGSEGLIDVMRQLARRLEEKAHNGFSVSYEQLTVSWHPGPAPAISDDFHKKDDGDNDGALPEIAVSDRVEIELKGYRVRTSKHLRDHLGDKRRIPEGRIWPLFEQYSAHNGATGFIRLSAHVWHEKRFQGPWADFARASNVITEYHPEASSGIHRGLLDQQRISRGFRSPITNSKLSSRPHGGLLSLHRQHVHTEADGNGSLGPRSTRHSAVGQPARPAATSRIEVEKASISTYIHHCHFHNAQRQTLDLDPQRAPTFPST